jgi:hypothetical protein
MAEAKRYDMAGDRDEAGIIVLYSDYAALEKLAVQLRDALARSERCASDTCATCRSADEALAAASKMLPENEK